MARPRSISNLVLVPDSSLRPSTCPCGDTEPAFDPTMLIGIQFHVVTNTTNAINVTALCISDLTAVVTSP